MNLSEVEAAVRLLEKVAREGGAPSHYVARHLLLALGAALQEAGGSSAAPWVERARRAGDAAGPAWRTAMATELSLACGEFVQSVDPRYVTLPDYDLDYTRKARSRLADRLAAARELGHELAPRETEMLALADRVLADLEAKRAARSD